MPRLDARLQYRPHFTPVDYLPETVLSLSDSSGSGICLPTSLSFPFLSFLIQTVLPGCSFSLPYASAFLILSRSSPGNTPAIFARIRGYLSACTVSSVKLNFFACFILQRCMRASLCKAMSNWRFNSVWRSMVYFLKLNHFVDLLPFSRLSLFNPVLKYCFRPCPISPFRTPVPF